MAKQIKMSKRSPRSTPTVPVAFIEELVSCTDGSALVREHLSIDPIALIAGVLTLFRGLEAGAAIGLL